MASKASSYSTLPNLSPLRKSGASSGSDRTNRNHLPASPQKVSQTYRSAIKYSSSAMPASIPEREHWLYQWATSFTISPFSIYTTGKRWSTTDKIEATSLGQS
ncbi:hypothetical protein OIU77_018504 [Salix suchowensis]|uniref:Uncharacterized protein n=1 Tax=Salix suchowensis TaxID=1278906 RepID=A0ABQ9CDR1_9ROSI|nr:hypothetical protein OIU77_018504 [Salix suchowensis]